MNELYLKLQIVFDGLCKRKKAVVVIALVIGLLALAECMSR